MHNITQRYGPSKNNGMLGAQFEFLSPCGAFQAFNYYTFEGIQIESSTLSNVKFDFLILKTNFISFYFVELCNIFCVHYHGTETTHKP